MTKQTEKPSFEASLAELEALVKQMESGDLPLEAALQTFEKGVALTRSCQTALDNAEQTVQQLLMKDGVLVSEPFDGGSVE